LGRPLDGPSSCEIISYNPLLGELQNARYLPSMESGGLEHLHEYAALSLHAVANSQL
jgi:hypothetical protein